MGIEEHDWRDAIVASSDLADFRLHPGPRFLADGLAPIAVKIGVPQSFAKTLCAGRVHQRPTLAKRLLQIRIGGTHDGALMPDGLLASGYKLVPAWSEGVKCYRSALTVVIADRTGRPLAPFRPIRARANRVVSLARL
jgi:hypothetical protein